MLKVSFLLPRAQGSVRQLLHNVHQVTFVKMFSRSSQNQGSFEISKGQIINVNLQVWDHMKCVTDDVDIVSLSVDRKQLFCETSSGMDMARRSCTQMCEL
jgi:hypothetical protein